MRARLAIQSAGIRVELREILLRDKPELFLETSASGTVPTLQDGDTVLDESLDIMIWALEQNDPQGLLRMPSVGEDLIKTNDGPFKAALDHTKYAVRFPDHDPVIERNKAAAFLTELDPMIAGGGWIFGERTTLADYAILPFVRQFANTDRAWFDTQPWPALRDWLGRFTNGSEFQRIMTKVPPWVAGQTPVCFGSEGGS